MTWKRLIYIGIVFCISFLVQLDTDIYSSSVSTNQDLFYIAETDYLSADDGQSHDYQLNEDALLPVSGNAITGRGNSQNSSARLIGGKKTQGRNAWTADVSYPYIGERPGNFIDDAFLCFPSGLYSSFHRLILLRKLRN